MALQDLLDISSSRKKVGLSEERIEPIKPYLREYIAYWREYPDMFISYSLVLILNHSYQY